MTARPLPPGHTRDRYAQCDDTCTVDCGPCKGAGRPAPAASVTSPKATPNPAPASREEREQGVIKCPSCGARQLRCFVREAELGSWCCGDCTAHRGQHEWNDTEPIAPEELS